MASGSDIAQISNDGEEAVMASGSDIAQISNDGEEAVMASGSDIAQVSNDGEEAVMTSGSDIAHQRAGACPWGGAYNTQAGRLIQATHLLALPSALTQPKRQPARTGRRSPGALRA